MKAIFLDRKTFNDSTSMQSIENMCSELVCYQTTNEKQIIERCYDGDIIISNKVMLTAQTLNNLPNLKLICVAATGTNNVDLAAAKEQNIAVTNVSGYAGNTLSQYVFSQILAYYSQTQHHNQNTEKGLWPISDTFCVLGAPITELANKTIGLVGYGTLSKAVEKIALAFGMQVIIADRPNTVEIRAGRLSFEQVLQQSDIISLHCPQTPETEGLFDANAFALMQPHAMLINTARGAIINNLDLLNALKTKQIGYAVLDVLEQEPPPQDHILLNALPELDNLKITAHIAWASNEAQQTLINLLAQNIASYLGSGNKNRVV